jgi:hypothetical protein
LNEFGIAITLVASVLLLTLPRRFAALPLLLCAAYSTRGDVLEVNSAHFSALRILVAVGILRVGLRGERIANGINSIDRMLVLWSGVLIASSIFHTFNTWVFRAGMVWTELGCYFLLRSFVQDWEGVQWVFKMLCVMLVPLAGLLLLEKSTGEDLFAVLGGVEPFSAIREGHVRAHGPFAHPILAGTVGATCISMGLYLWKRHRIYGMLGLLAGTTIVFASASSGPIMMCFFVICALAIWKVRSHLAAIRWAALGAVVALDLVMQDPVYFLMARIDVAGGSTGWFRARLLQSSLQHLDEWWLGGTDFTRHWMPTGNYVDDRNTDITNHFLAMGIMGGLPLLLAFILVLVAAFREVGRALYALAGEPKHVQFLVWTLGCILFGHVMNFFSISLYDQTIIFFYLVLAGVGAVRSVAVEGNKAPEREAARRVELPATPL